MISKEDNFFKNIDTKFSSNELIGNIIADEYEGESPEEQIYFINDKYYLKIDQNEEKVLGTYKFKVLKNIPLIILLGPNGERSTNYEGIIVKKDNQKYKVDWNHHDNYIYKVIENDDRNILYSVDYDLVKDFNFNNSNISFDILNSKIGVKLKEEKIIDNVCDSLNIYGNIATIFNSGKISIYNLNGKLLSKNLKTVYQYSTLYHQVIDSKNKMFFIDSLGNKYNKPEKYRTMWGNDSDKNRTVTYHSHKNKVLKVIHESFSLNAYKEPLNFDEFGSLNHKMYQLQTDARTYDKEKKILTIDDLENIVQEKNVEELLFLKKILKEEEYRREITYYLLSDFTNTIIVLPKGSKKVKFINNSTSKISAEDYWYYISFYKPLAPSYIIVKKSGKFGVWDLEKEKCIISFDYKSIEPKKGTHLLLSKNNLVTYYPYIGLIPKYKYLSDYNEYYARFEYPDGKKGWVNRKGIEYFD
ncbi:hypothetical protein QSV08_02680 [Maribacter sp. BPC-D8]|uniref:hypothetical protein n=1 Tax=Maribacter sp. BPC-D8 TaxID=3053613 RepID=UPI002B473A9E|nr:hypothetical protein [Maribacter sp. BPC-D8]WRI30148.1 hypothetical protein QSV08_02680 [Maribacter sp. BPC-D8]